MAETKARHIANLVEDDGDVKSAHLDNTTSATPTAVSDQANTSTGYFDVPTGTTNQRPGGSENSSVTPNAGNTRFNTTTGSLEFYDGSGWVSTNLIPTINSITGNIYAGVTSTLTLSLSSATDTIDVRYYEGNTLLATDSGRTVSNNSATSTVPSGVFNQTANDTISIEVLNSDGTPSSNKIDKTVTALPTGGDGAPDTTSVSGYRIHTYTSSGTFTNYINNLSIQYLVIGGGGGGGFRRAGGGGGGGYRCNVTGETSGRGNSANNETAVSLTGTSSGTVFDIEVGGGGAGSSSESPPGTDGGPSWIRLQGAGSTYLVRSEGGGGGGSADHPTEGDAPDGGCGGGAGSSWSTSSRSGGDGTTGQGYDGGDSLGTYNGGAGGGGGAGANGGNGSNNNAGNGGAGVTSSINGTATGRAGGGGGGVNSGTIGTATDGGGNGGKANSSVKQNGTDGKGGGGGGGEDGSGVNSYGGNGGDGIVIIRYQLP